MSICFMNRRFFILNISHNLRHTLFGGKGRVNKCFTIPHDVIFTIKSVTYFVPVQRLQNLCQVTPTLR